MPTIPWIYDPETLHFRPSNPKTKMSDEEEFGMGAGGPMVVEVKGRSRTPRSSRSPAHNHADSDDYSEDEGW